MSEIQYSAAELAPRILFADNHLLAVNKPEGLLSQDSGTGKRNLEDWAREWVREDKGKPGNVFLNAVHRIDRPVSGIVLFARTSKALSRLNEDIRQRKCKKIYHAIVEGAPPKSSEQLIHWLRHEHHKGIIGRKEDCGAQKAVLSYQILKRAEGRSLLEIHLETGRYHQIRTQLSAIGCPIVGDRKYGASTDDKNGIALHHYRLEMIHPTLKTGVFIEAPYPANALWQTALQGF